MFFIRKKVIDRRLFTMLKMLVIILDYLDDHPVIQNLKERYIACL